MIEDDAVVSTQRQGRWRRLARFLGADDDLPIDPDLDPHDPGEPSKEHHPQPHVRRAHPAVVAAIAVGGFVGTLGRYELTLALPTPDGHFPTSIFIINTSGAFLLGFLLTLILERFPPTRLLRPFACVGVLGGWTTMSTLAADGDTLIKAGRFALAGGYLAATLVAGVTAVTIGIALARVRTKAPDIEVAA
jgi:fluoride exporter